MNKYYSYKEVLVALNEGKRATRDWWLKEGKFIFQQVPATIGEEIIPKMQSLPQSVKDEFIKRGGSISYKNQFAMVYSDNTIEGWVARPADELTDDWIIFDQNKDNVGVAE